MLNRDFIKPLYMWAGGKRKFSSEIVGLFSSGSKVRNPEFTEKEFADFDKIRYVEPFFGAGAVFCKIINLYGLSRIETAIINDINKEIIGIYRDIQNDHQAFLNQVIKLQNEYIRLSTEGRKAWYVERRSEYWSNPSSPLLYFLMLTCFNGIWQTCSKSNGLFGTPARSL